MTRMNEHPGIGRRVACTFLLMVHVAGCASAGHTGQVSQGELHNDGVRYVLERLERTSPQPDVSRIAGLTREYCATIGRQCPASLRVPSFPIDSDPLVESANVSAGFKSNVRALFRAGRGATLSGFVRMADSIERQAMVSLAPSEREQFSSVVSVARESARLWAPTSEGGRGGGGTRLPPGGTVQAKINWQEVYEADAAGCVLSMPLCLDGAIVFSAADIAWQIAHDNSDR